MVFGKYSAIFCSKEALPGSIAINCKFQLL